MVDYPSHDENLVSLRRIEGQVRGIQKMIQERKYCVDILNQIRSAIMALASVEDKILEKHFQACVGQAVRGSSSSERTRKLEEILKLLKQFRKL
ncbi:MAG: metal-sensitive transcriptional regulator [Candidatus Omnitrophota bacterium]